MGRNGNALGVELDDLVAGPCRHSNGELKRMTPRIGGSISESAVPFLEQFVRVLQGCRAVEIFRDPQT
jgi:hypothetical protein